MTFHKPCAALLLLVSGAIPVGLSGCRNPGATYTEKSETAISDSGAVSITRMGGEIDVDDAPHGASLSTMGGDIHIKSVASFAHVKTMGGNIDIDKANGSVDAVSMGGNIVIDKAGGAVKASTNGGNVTVHLVAGADDPSSAQHHDVELTSNGGNIELTVPENFPMDVQVTLAYTKTATKAYRIEDNIGLTQHTSSNWDDSEGTPRKYIRAQGVAGNGSNHVVIKTINGDVIVRRE